MTNARTCGLGLRRVSPLCRWRLMKRAPLPVSPKVPRLKRPRKRKPRKRAPKKRRLRKRAPRKREPKKRRPRKKKRTDTSEID